LIDQTDASAPVVTSPASPPKIGVITATGIVVANIIGTGVFTSLGFQLTDIRSGFALVLLWVVGGVVALCGALCYGELSAALPRSGGEYHFLSSIYHPALGFMAGFVSATVGFAAPIALAAMAFGTYFHGATAVSNPIVLSLAVVWFTALVHLTGLRTGSLFQNIATSLKTLLIGALIVTGLFLVPHQSLPFLPQPGDGATVFSGAFAVALVYVMYSYSGWNAAAYIAGEIDRPERNVPRALLWGTLIVLVIYAALNAAFLATTPLPELAGKLEVALISGKYIFGEQGGRIVGGIICLGLVSAISSMAWVGPRVTMAMGEDHWLLGLLGHKNSRGVPVAAILLQLVIVTVFLLRPRFQMVVIYIQFTLLLCSLLTVVGVIVLRYRRPELPRPYRVWAYPLPPLIFAGVTVWMMIYLLRSHLTESLFGLGTMLIGLLFYFLTGKRSLPAS
jgi:APA family basic amino acid/polyamine antiporter